MPITINEIIEGSIAAKSKLKIYDRIISINGNRIHDFLDLQFHTADDDLKIIYLDQSGIECTLELHQDWETPLGIIPEEHKCRTCTNPRTGTDGCPHSHCRRHQDAQDSAQGVHGGLGISAGLRDHFT